MSQEIPALRLIKRLPCEYVFALLVNAIHLRKAAELLRTTAMNISEVAWATGFNDPGYFARVFQEEFGKTPKEWRS